MKHHSPQSGGDSFFSAHIADLFSLADSRGAPCYSDFLSAEEQSTALCIAKRCSGECSYALFGGFNNAERAVMAVFPLYNAPCEDDFPISKLSFEYRSCDKLSHRDFLGALMSLGIKRSSVGDIAVGEGYTVVCVKREIEKYICENTEKIGRVGVTVSIGDSRGAQPCTKTEELSITVASMRLDNITAALCNDSRSSVKERIASAQVILDGIVCQNTSKSVKPGSVLTIRGKGKFILGDDACETKKGRVRLTVSHYI